MTTQSRPIYECARCGARVGGNGWPYGVLHGQAYCTPCLAAQQAVERDGARTEEPVMREREGQVSGGFGQLLPFG